MEARLPQAPEDLTHFCTSVHPRLVGALSLYTNDRDVAQEIAQDCLVRICRDWRKVKQMSNREGWALRVAMNLANSLYRRKAAERRARQKLQARSRLSATSQHDWTEGLALRRALRALPSRQRAVLIMRFYADMPFMDVARAMQIPESTAKSLARRGLERLRTDPSVPSLKGAPVV